MKALGIDHGDKRMGIAASDDLGMLAHPLAKTRTSPGNNQELPATTRSEGMRSILTTRTHGRLDDQRTRATRAVAQIVKETERSLVG